MCVLPLNTSPKGYTNQYLLCPLPFLLLLSFLLSRVPSSLRYVHYSLTTSKPTCGNTIKRISSLCTNDDRTRTIEARSGNKKCDALLVFAPSPACCSLPPCRLPSTSAKSARSPSIAREPRPSSANVASPPNVKRYVCYAIAAACWFGSKLYHRSRGSEPRSASARDDSLASAAVRPAISTLIVLRKITASPSGPSASTAAPMIIRCARVPSPSSTVRTVLATPHPRSRVVCCKYRRLLRRWWFTCTTGGATYATCFICKQQGHLSSKVRRAPCCCVPYCHAISYRPTDTTRCSAPNPHTVCIPMADAAMCVDRRSIDIATAPTAPRSMTAMPMLTAPHPSSRPLASLPTDRNKALTSASMTLPNIHPAEAAKIAATMKMQTALSTATLMS